MAKGFNPIELGEKLRQRLILGYSENESFDDKIMLAKFGATSQAPESLKASKLKSDFFRTKQYWKPGEEDYFRGEPAGIASVKLGIPKEECNTVFLVQINACNLRCWYCYVDEKNLCASLAHAGYFTTDEILLNFLAASKKYEYSENPADKINILRLSGGEVFLAPELIYWTIQSVKRFGLEDRIYLWVDCNLSTGDFFWKYLLRDQIDEIRNFKNLGICVCYKGFDEESFHYNTGAAPEFFYEQFKMHRRLINENFDVYSYIYPISIFTGNDSDFFIDNYIEKMSHFLGKLRSEVSFYAPLRMEMPSIKKYEANKSGITPQREKLLELQPVVRSFWEQIISDNYYYSKHKNLPLHEIPL